MDHRTKEFIKQLNKNGYSLKRIRGGHHIYSNGTQTVSIPLRLNIMIQKRLIKELKLA